MPEGKKKQFTPDPATAVEEAVYIIEHEEAKASTKRNAEVVAAARNVLKALTGSKHVPTAKVFIERERSAAVEDLNTKAYEILRAVGMTAAGPNMILTFYNRLREEGAFARAQDEIAAIISRRSNPIP